MSRFLWKWESSWAWIPVKAYVWEACVYVRVSIGFPSGTQVLRFQLSGLLGAGPEEAWGCALSRHRSLCSRLAGASNSGLSDSLGSIHDCLPIKPLVLFLPMRMPYCESFSFPYIGPWWIKINISTCTTFHLFLHSLNGYLLSLSCMPGTELSPGRWGSKVWPLCTRRVYNPASKYASKSEALKLVRSVLYTRGSGWVSGH